jgi:UDP-N-acetylglucosamine 2-epimerase (non-hydrolysing)
VPKRWAFLASAELRGMIMQKLRIMTIFGTRPEAIKMCPVVLEMQKYPDYIEPIVAVTAQHREMLDQVLHLFKIVPDYDLNIMTAGQTLYDITERALQGLQGVLQEAKPDLVLVHGDTTTTFVGALAAFYAQIPVGHVEAGLRTGDKYSPFPEEMNRKLTGSLADLHFAPTSISKSNLLKENVNPARIYVTGNTVIDALHATVKPDFVFDDSSLSAGLAQGGRWILMTTHRRENLGEPMRHVYQALKEVLETHPDVQAIFPMHKNPKVRIVAESVLGQMPQVHLIEPMDYEPFANLMSKVDIVLTDSGGIQEEAPALGKPVLVLRDTTERPEAITAGTVKLIGTSKEVVLKETNSLLDDETRYKAMADACNPYGDGQAAKRIICYILEHFGYPVAKMEEFTAGN